MSTQFLSRWEIIRRTIFVILAVGLVILMAIVSIGLSERQLAAILLIASMMLFVIGGILFTGRAIWKWPIGQTLGYLRWERGFVVVALLANVLGFVMLEGLLRTAEASNMVRLALAIYVVGAGVGIVAEMSYIHSRAWVYPQIVFHVVLAFLAQAMFGLALLRTDLVALWVGWVTIIWNVAWLVVLTVASPRDMYFPVLHHVAPFIIGIALLTSR